MAKIEFLWEKNLHKVVNWRLGYRIFPIGTKKMHFLWEICIAKQIPQGFRGATPRRRGSGRPLAGCSEGETSPSWNLKPKIWDLFLFILFDENHLLGNLNFFFVAGEHLVYVGSWQLRSNQAYERNNNQTANHCNGTTVNR